MKELFEMAAGSVAGSDHRWSGRNSQDAHYCLLNEGAIIAVVCDGCSEGKYSEVGAQIGARLITESLQQNLKYYSSETGIRWASVLEKTRNDVLAQLRILSLAMGGSLTETVTDYFLFTAVGAIIAPEETAIFSIGDGLFVLNGDLTKIGPFPNNEPPYLVYGGLVESSLSEKNPDLVKFQLHGVIPTESLEAVLVGTDGAGDLIEAADLKMPGKEETVGNISQFWLQDQYFFNRDMVHRKLTLVNREISKPIWTEQRVAKEKGLLPDDTTLAVVRRKADKKEGKKPWKFF